MTELKAGARQPLDGRLRAALRAHALQAPPARLSVERIAVAAGRIRWRRRARRCALALTALVAVPASILAGGAGSGPAPRLELATTSGPWSAPVPDADAVADRPAAAPRPANILDWSPRGELPPGPVRTAASRELLRSKRQPASTPVLAAQVWAAPTTDRRWLYVFQAWTPDRRIAGGQALLVVAEARPDGSAVRLYYAQVVAFRHQRPGEDQRSTRGQVGRVALVAVALSRAQALVIASPAVHQIWYAADGERFVPEPPGMSVALVSRGSRTHGADARDLFQGRTAQGTVVTPADRAAERLALAGHRPRREGWSFDLAPR